MTRPLWLLLGLELRLQLRSRVLWMLVILPVLGGTALGLSGGELTAEDLVVEPEKKEREKPTYRVAAPDDIADALDAHERVEVVARSAEGFATRPDEVQAAVERTVDGYVVRGDGQSGDRAARLVDQLIEKESRLAWRAEWASAAPVDPVTLVRYGIEAEPPPPTPLPQGALLAFVVAGFLGLTAYGASTQAYTTARQRKTRHTLALVPAPPTDVHLAKLLAIGIVATANGGLATLAWVAARTVSLGELPLSPVGLGLAAVATVCLALQMGSAWSIVTAWAPDRRTVSFVGSLVLLSMLGMSAPAFLPEAPLALAVLPIVGATWAIRAAAEVSQPAFVVLAAIATLGWVALGLRGAARFWDREHGELRNTGAREALALYTLAMLLVWFLGQAAAALDPLWGLVFLQLGLVAGPALAGVGWLGRPLWQTLALTRPRASDLGIGALIGCGTPLLALGAMALQQPLVPMPEAWAEEFGRALLADRPLWANVLLIAVLPGICEELLFRGALLGLARDALSDRWAVVLVAIGFGLVHLAAPRILPTAVLGVVLGVVVVRTGTLWPAMVAHTTHNATSVAWASAEEPHPAVLAVSAVAGLVGLALLWRRR